MIDKISNVIGYDIKHYAKWCYVELNETKNRMYHYYKRPKKIIQPLAALASIIVTSLIVWRFIVLYSGLANPVVVIISGSMEPTLYRGDVMLLHNPTEYKAGDIMVFHVTDRDIPIVHRLANIYAADDTETELEQIEKRNRSVAKRSNQKNFIQKIFDNDDDIFNIPDNLTILTKGDHNYYHDQELYEYGKKWLNKYDISGIGSAYFPYAGMFTIWLHEYPLIKYSIFITLTYLVMSGSE